MINIIDKHYCCGCSACTQKCPKNCISMIEDEEGFMYPQIDDSLCIECGLCEKVCPFLNSKEIKKVQEVYAAKNKDDKKKYNSSSGGVFVSLAEYVLNNGGVVFGAAFNNNLVVEHICVESIDNLHLIMGSKYVQSNINTTYIQCRNFLEKNRLVLFSGTSCQIMGLNLFLKKKYNNLLSVDVICHGVPSPGVWRKYINLELKKIGISPKQTLIKFRDKNTGWENYSFSIYDKTKNDSLPIKTSIFYKNIYMNGFLSNIILRPSCFNCPAKSGKAQSDITLADFWGIKNSYSEFYDNYGVSLILVHTEKGHSYVEKSNFEAIKVDFEEAIKNNPSYNKSVNEPETREMFFSWYKKGIPVDIILKKILHVSLIKRVINKFKRLI